MLQEIGSTDLADSIDQEYCREKISSSWLKKFCQTIGITVNQFFNQFSELMKRDPHLILNYDGIHVSSRKMFKVLTISGWGPLKSCKEKLPHFSAMETISGSRTAFEPMFILLYCLNMTPNLEEFSEEGYFISTESGWMNQWWFVLEVYFLFFLNIFESHSIRGLSIPFIFWKIMTLMSWYYHHTI